MPEDTEFLTEWMTDNHRALTELAALSAAFQVVSRSRSRSRCADWWWKVRHWDWGHYSLTRGDPQGIR
jgi:hypothetical protein